MLHRLDDDNPFDCRRQPGKARLRHEFTNRIRESGRELCRTADGLKQFLMLKVTPYRAPEASSQPQAFSLDAYYFHGCLTPPVDVGW